MRCYLEFSLLVVWVLQCMDTDSHTKLWESNFVISFASSACVNECPYTALRQLLGLRILDNTLLHSNFRVSRYWWSSVSTTHQIVVLGKCIQRDSCVAPLKKEQVSEQWNFFQLMSMKKMNNSVNGAPTRDKVNFYQACTTISHHKVHETSLTWLSIKQGAKKCNAMWWR